MGSPLISWPRHAGLPGWAKPFGDHKQAGAKLLLEQHVKSGNRGLGISRNGCPSHTGSAAGLPVMEGIKASAPAKAKGQLKKSQESSSNTDVVTL